MKTIQMLLLGCLLITSLGCASITRGTKDTLVVNSDPSGAKVTLSNGYSGKTPCSFKVSRKGGFVVKIEKEGYETVEVQVEGQISGGGAAGMAGNVVLGGLIGAGVDAATGATKDLKPNPIDVKLVPIKQDGISPGQTNIYRKVLELKVSILDQGEDYYLLSISNT